MGRFNCIILQCHVKPTTFTSLNLLTLLLPESIVEICSVVLTFESVDEILQCDHSNETSSAVLLHGLILGFFLNFDMWRSWELKD